MPQVVLPGKLVWAFSLLILAFWVFRNTPAYPFAS